jgi:DNA-binding NarL/FixJ family response regulator
MIESRPLDSSKANGSRKTRVLIIDDHPMVRIGLSQILADQPDMEVCGQGEDGVAALQLFDELHPDVIILDLSLKTGSGIEVIKQLRAKKSDVKILIFSLHEELVYSEHTLHAGAKGFVNKQASTETVVDAIRQILAGHVFMSKSAADRMLNRIVNGVKGGGSPLEQLSDRELEVFQHLGEGLTTRQIADKLYLSPKTIETHRENIKKKLNLINSVELLHRAVSWVVNSQSQAGASESQPTGEVAQP